MNRVEGFSLIEVLVALVVLSIGLLGIAALHVDSVRNGQSALQRTRAVNLAADIADRIRANPPAANYDVGAAAAGNEPATQCADNAAAEVTAPCTPAAMAVFDVWQWRTAIEGLAEGLPNGAGSIDLDDTTDPDSLVIDVSWSDKGLPYTYSLTVQQ